MVVLVRAGVVLFGPVDVGQDIGEHFDRSSVVVHHQEGESQVIIETDVACGDVHMEALVVIDKCE